ncbi:DNA-protecting protein DprA [Marinococcus halophilus]|uniref:DNA processing protein DprA n=1 Tax=Marinococcus halophilus TaxID=1371 RepID=A0A510Y3G3_MARHA|nr:DNA-processing protein DprA [Marinococcus halophilus]OZT81425.1 DNA-protecting protein DprA [Marinococcus halophilus]GEK57381.1 DNA processing protein DprA [Marinococcus halophilus]
MHNLSFNERLLAVHEFPLFQWKHVAELMRCDPELLLPFKQPHLLPLNNEHLIAWRQYVRELTVQRRLSWYREQGIGWITYFDVRYPSSLKSIYDAPWVLYTKGNTGLLREAPRLAVVGSRSMTSYGKKAVEAFLPEKAAGQLQVVSGLARGVDGHAHRHALKAGYPVIAVLGSGFGHLYPKEHLGLAKNIAASGLLLSEYAPDRPPRKWHFPARNRIISGLSDKIFVVEADVNSGSLITASLALEQGRDVCALPGPVFSKQSSGTNQLIYDGALPVLQPEDLSIVRRPDSVS